MDIEKKKRLTGALMGVVAGLTLAALPAVADILTKETTNSGATTAQEDAAWNALTYTKPDAGKAEFATQAGFTDQANRAEYADEAGTAEEAKCLTGKCDPGKDPDYWTTYDYRSKRYKCFDDRGHIRFLDITSGYYQYNDNDPHDQNKQSWEDTRLKSVTVSAPPDMNCLGL